MKFIPYGQQWLDQHDIDSVTQVLLSDWITQGPTVKKFEQKLAEYCGAKYAVAVSSGTAALHLAMLAAEVKTGDLVITSPITFVASANCAIYGGARPHFVDINPKTLCLSSAKLQEYLEDKANQRPKAVIPVHFAGHPAEVEKIYELAQEYNFLIVEDACHALGAKYQTSDGKWHKIGSCHHSDMAVFSFHPVKHITTGEGGAITTNNKELYELLQLLRTHGITRETPKKESEPWYYEMQYLGFNYRITDIQCALGLTQLKKVDAFVKRRRELALVYIEQLQSIDQLVLPFEDRKVQSSYHLFPIQVKGVPRQKLFVELLRKNIGVNVHYIPVHLQPYYRQRYGYKKGDFPIAENYYEDAITLPLFPKMTDEQQEYIIKMLKNCLNAI